MSKRKDSVTKGTSSAVLLSVLIHVGLFLLAGTLVVFTVIRRPEQKFDPPKVTERPKMKLKKPRVKVRKSGSPKPNARIVTKAQQTPMPVINLPEMSGTGLGEGLGGGVSGFDGILEIDEISLLGSRVSLGNDLVGTYYDTKRDRSGKNISCSVSMYKDTVNRFLRRGWDRAVLSRYYQSPTKLYAQSIVIPETMATMAPLAFADKEGVGALWLVHYQGTLVHKEGIRFRFWGSANIFMVVRVDRKIVLAACWNDARRGEYIGNLWESSDIRSDNWYWGRGYVQIGDWITLEPGVPLDMEVVLGDNGASTGFILAVEVEGVEYERSGQGAPILPVFRTGELSRDYLDQVYRELPEGEVCLTNGPIFRDF